MNLEEAISFLERKGYCLWVGAGLTTHISNAGGKPTPSWQIFVEQLEKAAALSEPAFSCSFPERIEVVKRTLSRIQFQKAIRDLLLIPLLDSIISLGQTDTEKFLIPSEVTQIACLGMLANHIVNFNIETITSTLLAAPSGPYVIKAYEPPVVGASGIRSSKGSMSGACYRRSVLHPHGAFDMYGLCILSTSDYKSMDGTLALQLAVHAAFQEYLVIIGMSLEDIYLREQVTLFRNQINDVLWFTDKETDDENIQKWVWENNIKIIRIHSWPNFWRHIEETLPHPNKEKLLSAWMHVISYCFRIRKENKSMNSDIFQDIDIPTHWRLLDENRGISTPPSIMQSGQDENLLNQITRNYLREIKSLHV